MTRHIKRGGKIWIRMFPDKPVTKKPLKLVWAKERARLSTGWRWLSRAEFFTRLRCGRKDSPRRDEAGITKLPVKTKFVTRAEQEGGAL